MHRQKKENRKRKREKERETFSARNNENGEATAAGRRSSLSCDMQCYGRWRWRMGGKLGRLDVCALSLIGDSADTRIAYVQVYLCVRYFILLLIPCPLYIIRMLLRTLRNKKALLGQKGGGGGFGGPSEGVPSRQE